jgi:hypothetical protein
MGGKYSAEWWEKIASINGELSKQLDNPGTVEHFIARIASGRSLRRILKRRLRRIVPTTSEGPAFQLRRRSAGLAKQETQAAAFASPTGPAAALIWSTCRSVDA